MKKKRKSVVKKLAILLLVVIIVIFALIVVKDKFMGKKAVKGAVVVDKLDAYGYVLEDNKSKYYVSLFKKLKTTLTSKTVDKEHYAKLVSQLFLSDYFNLDNKVSKNNVGGVQFVYKEYQDSFIHKSKDEVYKYVESNIYGNRKQELPKVVEVVVDNMEKISHEYANKIDDSAYSVDLTIVYDKDMGYQTKVNLILINTGKKLEIVKMS